MVITTPTTGSCEVLKFGTPSIPYPYIAEGKAGNPDTFFGMPHLTGISDQKALALPTHHKDLGLALGLLLRNLPPYNMLDIQLDMIQAFHPEATRKVVTVFGEKGASKTQTMLNLCEVVHPRGGILTEMGGKNFRYLFEDFGIDTKQSGAFALQFEHAERRSELDPATIEAVDKKYEDLKNRHKIDADEGEATSLTDKLRATLAHLENGDLRDFIDRITALQGWGGHNTGLNFTSRPGIIWDAILEERPLIIDEIDKAERGSIASINTFLQFLTAPETIKEYTVTFENGEKRIIRRTNDLSMDSGPHWDEEAQADVYYMKPTCTVLMAGNYANDGAASNDLPSSVYDRLKPKFVAPPTAADFACVWAGKLYGLNLPVLYEMNQKLAEDDMARFCRLTEVTRDVGTTPQQRQERYDRAPWTSTALDASKMRDTLLGLKKLGMIIELRRDILDEDSELRKPGQATGNLQNLSTEGVNAAFSRKFPQTYRTIKDAFERATGLLPELVAINDLGGFPDFSAEQLIAAATGDIDTLLQVLDMKDVGAQLGTRLTEVLETDRILMARDKPTLEAVLREREQKELGLITDPSGTDEASLASLLNIDPASMLKLSPEAQRVQDAIHAEMATLLGKDGRGHGIIGSNKHMVVPAQPIQRGLVVVRQSAATVDEITWPEPHKRKMVLPRLTRDLDIAEFKKSPLCWYDARDPLAATAGAQDRVGQRRQPPEERRKLHEARERNTTKTERATLSAVVLGLTLPILKDYNLSSIWTPAIEGKIGGETEKTVAPIMSGTHEHGYAYTCFAVSNPMLGDDRKRGGKSAETAALDTLHMFFNRQRPDQFLFVGGPVPESLATYMEESGVDYFERLREDDMSALQERTHEIETILAEKFEIPYGDDADKEAKAIRDAYRRAITYRSRIESEGRSVRLDDKGLGTLLIDPKLRFSKPLVVTANKAEPLLQS